MKNFVPAPKGVKPVFTVNPERQLKIRLDEYGKPQYSWELFSGEVKPLKYMTDYHILQIKGAMEEQAMKWRRCWYIFDQELKRRNVGITGRLIKKGNGVKFAPVIREVRP